MRSAPMPLRLAGLTAALTFLLVAPSIPGASGAGVQLALATLLVASMLLVVTTADVQAPSAQAVRAWRLAACAKRAPARQCDPDSAGHVRSRAPGVSQALFVS
jgi:Family of unknown function (DUF6412)